MCAGISDLRRQLSAATSAETRRLRGWIVPLSLAIIVSGFLGYWMGANRALWSGVLPVREGVPLEYYVTERSFSEVENTKARLEALSLEFLTELRARHTVAASNRGSGRSPGNPSYGVQPERAIEEAQRGVAEFKGTEPEKRLVKELLVLFKKNGLWNQWLDAYLEFLYEHPTDTLVTTGLKDAVMIGRQTFREEELKTALDWVKRVPVKYRIESESFGSISTPVRVSPLEPGGNPSFLTVQPHNIERGQ